MDWLRLQERPLPSMPQRMVRTEEFFVRHWPSLRPFGTETRVILEEPFAVSVYGEVYPSAGPHEEARKASWGVVQSVGHLTVNEDGEGSNPSAPANPPETARFIFSVLTKYGFSNN